MASGRTGMISRSWITVLQTLPLASSSSSDVSHVNRAAGGNWFPFRCWCKEEAPPSASHSASHAASDSASHTPIVKCQRNRRRTREKEAKRKRRNRSLTVEASSCYSLRLLRLRECLTEDCLVHIYSCSLYFITCPEATTWRGKMIDTWRLTKESGKQWCPKESKDQMQRCTSWIYDEDENENDDASRAFLLFSTNFSFLSMFSSYGFFFSSLRSFWFDAVQRLEISPRHTFSSFLVLYATSDRV